MPTKIQWSPNEIKTFETALQESTRDINTWGRIYCFVNLKDHNAIPTYFRSQRSSLNVILNAVNEIRCSNAATVRQISHINTSLETLKNCLINKKAAWYYKLPIISWLYDRAKNKMAYRITQIQQNLTEDIKDKTHKFIASMPREPIALNDLDAEIQLQKEPVGSYRIWIDPDTNLIKLWMKPPYGLNPLDIVELEPVKGSIQQVIGREGQLNCLRRIGRLDHHGLAIHLLKTAKVGDFYVVATPRECTILMRFSDQIYKKTVRNNENLFIAIEELRKQSGAKPYEEPIRKPVSNFASNFAPNFSNFFNSSFFNTPNFVPFNEFFNQPLPPPSRTRPVETFPPVIDPSFIPEEGQDPPSDKAKPYYAAHAKKMALHAFNSSLDANEISFVELYKLRKKALIANREKAAATKEMNMAWDNFKAILAWCYPKENGIKNWGVPAMEKLDEITKPKD